MERTKNKQTPKLLYINVKKSIFFLLFKYIHILIHIKEQTATSIPRKKQKRAFDRINGEMMKQNDAVMGTLYHQNVSK